MDGQDKKGGESQILYILFIHVRSLVHHRVNGRSARYDPRMKTLRISHPAFSGIHREATIAFYRDLLGMEIVLRQDNLDFPSEEHLFFHIGDDNFIAYFVPKEGADLSIYKPAQSGSGWMDHLAIDFELDELEAMRERLVAAGVEVEGPIDRGYERSIYFKDPNGITIELLA